MFAFFKRMSQHLSNWSGSDTSIPVFDGALKPNNLLDTAEILFEDPTLTDMAIDSHGRLVVACGRNIFQLEPGDNGSAHQPVAQLGKPVNAICRFGDGLVASTEDSLVFVNGKYDGRQVSQVDGWAAQCVTAISEGNDGLLLITQGAAQTRAEDWATDLLNGGKTGRLVTYDPASEQVQLCADKIAYGYGVVCDGSRTLVSESWANRILIWNNNEIEVGLSELPGYPSRIAPASDGGFWLTVFAPRSQLLEFVLRETDFRKEMMQSVDPKYWISPALSSGKDFLEPLQQGGVRQMGTLKPWAPARSYGLVLKLSSDLVPLASWHSRVGGSNHGIVTALELNGSLLALSRGAGRVLRVPLTDQLRN